MERKQLRLKKYDYSKDGAYFITMCIYEKKKILCRIYRRGDPCGRPIIEYSVLGKIAENTIKVIENKFNVKIDKYVIMPNHIHMILIIENRTTARVVAYNKIEDFISSFFTLRQRRKIKKNDTVSSIVSAYKSIIANEYV